MPKLGPLSSALGLSEPQAIAIAGSGGKTTLLFSLARELAQTGRKVVVTTSTMIFPPQGAQAGAAWLLEGSIPTPREVEARLEKNRLICLADRRNQVGKLVGLRPGQFAPLYDMLEKAWVLLEADGSAGKPLKAWAGHEPVVPPGTGLMVVMAGARGIGAPLNSEMVHRPELFSAAGGLEMGRPVDPAALARVIRGPAGPLKVLPPQARAVFILNQIDAASPKVIRELVREMRGEDGGSLGGAGFERILLGRLNTGYLREP